MANNGIVFSVHAFEQTHWSPNSKQKTRYVDPHRARGPSIANLPPVTSPLSFHGDLLYGCAILPRRKTARIYPLSGVVGDNDPHLDAILLELYGIRSQDELRGGTGGQASRHWGIWSDFLHDVPVR